MRRLLKPLRVLLALALFLCVNAAFLAPAVKTAFLLDGVPDFAWAARVQFLPALVRLSIDAASCVSCGLCEKGCKAGAIDAKGKVVDNSRCVRCFNCLGTCGKGAVRL